MTRRRGTVAACLLGALVLLQSTASASPSPEFSLAWRAPTPADGTAFTVVAGSTLTIPLAVRAGGQKIAIRASGRPLRGSAVVTPGGVSATAASFTWTPRPDQVGDHVVVLTARDSSSRRLARPRAFFVYVEPVELPSYEALSGPEGMFRSAHILRSVVVRARPSSGAPAVGRLQPFTPEQTDNLVLLLAQQPDVEGHLWVRVRLAVLPNNSSGWVPREALGPYRELRTHLVVSREQFTATLYRSGRAIFRARVGVGRSYLPTPAGRFYVRVKLIGFDDPMYGPLAFGTSARAPLLPKWPGGGFVGIHGTNKPELLPGAVSHGCIRMRNRDILRLARLLPLGTPLTIV